MNYAEAYAKAREHFEAQGTWAYRGEFTWTENGDTFTLYVFRFGPANLYAKFRNGAYSDYVRVPTADDEGLAAAIARAHKLALTLKQRAYRERRIKAMRAREARLEAERVARAPYVLVQWRFSWADEFDVCGWHSYTQEEWRAKRAALEASDWPKERGFGTNESLEWESFRDFERGLTIRPLTKAQYKALKQVFPHDDDFGWPHDF